MSLFQVAMKPQQLIHGSTPRHSWREESATISGGDYVDVRQLAGDRKLFILADVSGKGIEAAYIAHNLRREMDGVLRMHPFASDLPLMAGALETQISPFLTHRHSYITLIIGTIACLSGDLRYVNAGHPAPIIVARDGCHELDNGKNAPIGFLGEKIVESRTALNPEETVVLYTDGFSDRVDNAGSPIGARAIAAAAHHCLQQSHAMSLNFVSRNMEQSLDRFPSPCETGDDSSFLLLRRVPLDSEMFLEHAFSSREARNGNGGIAAK